MFAKERSIVTRCIAGEAILVPIRNDVGSLDSIFTLNESGYLIWQLIDQHLNFDRIVETFTNEYEISPEQATSDISEFLTRLQSAGLIHAVEEAMK